MYRKIAKILLISFITLNLQAEEPAEIRVEILCFQNSPSLAEDFDLETWPQFIGDIAVSEELINANTLPRVLPKDYKIARPRNYQILLHKAWQQNLDIPVYFANKLKIIEGVAKFKYTHNIYQVNLELIYNLSDGQKRYSINRRIRLKNNDAYYFDHPLFGAILRISAQN